MKGIPLIISQNREGALKFPLHLQRNELHVYIPFPCTFCKLCCGSRVYIRTVPCSRGLTLIVIQCECDAISLCPLSYGINIRTIDTIACWLIFSEWNRRVLVSCLTSSAMFTYIHTRKCIRMLLIHAR